jgi:hypothetical protein
MKSIMTLPPISLPSSGSRFTKELQRLLRDVSCDRPPLLHHLRNLVAGTNWATDVSQRYEQIREAIIRTQLAGLSPAERFGFCVSLAASFCIMAGRPLRNKYKQGASDRLAEQWIERFWDILHPLCPDCLSSEEQSNHTPYWIGPFSETQGWLWLTREHMVRSDGSDWRKYMFVSPSPAQNLSLCVASCLWSRMIDNSETCLWSDPTDNIDIKGNLELPIWPDRATHEGGLDASPLAQKLKSIADNERLDGLVSTPATQTSPRRRL